jgi:hypothetical protein
MQVTAMFRTSAALVIATLLATGCATFKDSEFPVVQKLPDKSAFSNKPSVFVNAKFYRDMTENLSNSTEVPAALPTLKTAAEKVTKESGLFSKYTLDPFNGRDMDYQIKLDMINHVPNMGAAMISGFITGFTLFIIPSAATDNYVLRASVLDKAGNVIKKYEYRSHVTTWFGIWMLPLAGNSPQSVVPEHWENMIKRAYEQIIKDDMLRYSAVPQFTDKLAYALPEDRVLMIP